VGEGTDSARLFTPGERKVLAKSKVHQGSRARDYGSWVDLTDLKNMDVCQEWDKQYFNFQKHIFGKSPFTQCALKHFLFEEMRRIY
jgi:6-pyruvoyl-tetrahydropterin synthase